MRAFAFNLVLCGAAFAWLFSQTPAAQPEPVSTETTRAIPGQQDRRVETIEPAAMHIRERVPAAGATIYEVVSINLKLRRKPVLTSRLHRVYPRGARFEQLGRDGNWLNVRHLADGSSGWLPVAALRAIN